LWQNQLFSGVQNMCIVWIVSDSGVVAVSPEHLEVKVRLSYALRRMGWYESAPKVQRQPKPAAKVRFTVAPAPLQCGGDLMKMFPDTRWSKEDSVSHYSQRCGEHNHREQACRKTKRRRQVVQY
jgi:hypothetical protein